VPKNDVALLKITSQPSGLAPIPPLPTSQKLTNSDEGKTVTIVGFGETSNGKGDSGTKYYGTSKISALCATSCSSCNGYGSCDGAYEGAFPGNVCYSADPSLICSGDSGGPDLIVRNGTTYVAGVHSFGTNCSQSGADSCSTAVDEYTSFIQQYIGTQYANGHACTSSDQCASGLCADGQWCCDTASITNPSLSGGDCSAACYTCSSGSCTPLDGATHTGGSCDDGSACTTNDTCVAGVCQGTPKSCPGSYCELATGNCHVTTGCTGAGDCTGAAVCQVPTCSGGTCSYPTASNGTYCTSGGLTGACNNGQCITGSGPCAGQPEGASCTLPLNACVLSATCQGGTCTATSTKTCAPSGNTCAPTGVCDPSNGICGYAPVTNGTTCNDNNPCTDNDHCSGGTCTGTPNSNTCGADQCHDAGQCNPATGTCSGTPKANGTQCNDNDPTTVNDQCVNGSCVGVNPCAGQADGTACSNGVVSNGTCSGGVCTATTTGCAGKPDGTACDDGNSSTINDHCVSGVCVGTPVTSSCTGQQDGTACDDHNACTRSDQCLNGVCTGTNPVVCAAPSACHQPGACDYQTGLCAYVNLANGDPCTDTNGNAGSCVNGRCNVTSSSVDGGGDECSGKSDGTTCTGGTCTGGTCVLPGGGGTCGCGTAGSGPASGLFLALAMMAILRRRRLD
jgi:MYXO-CTERM domain-containing protein